MYKNTKQIRFKIQIKICAKMKIKEGAKYRLKYVQNTDENLKLKLVRADPTTKPVSAPGPKLATLQLWPI